MHVLYFPWDIIASSHDTFDAFNFIVVSFFITAFHLWVIQLFSDQTEDVFRVLDIHELQVFESLDSSNEILVRLIIHEF